MLKTPASVTSGFQSKGLFTFAPLLWGSPWSIHVSVVGGSRPIVPGPFPWWQRGHVHALQWRGTFSAGWRVPIVRRVIWTGTCAQKHRISNAHWIIIPHFWRQPRKFTNCPHCLAHNLNSKLCKASPLSHCLVKKAKGKTDFKDEGVADVKCSFQYKTLPCILETVTPSFIHVSFVLCFPWHSTALSCPIWGCP